MERSLTAEKLLINPGFDVDSMLGENTRPEELVYAMDRQKTRN